MADISAAGTFACIALATLPARFLVQAPLIWRLAPGLFLIPGAYFAFNKFDAPIPEWASVTIAITALLALVTGGTLNLRDGSRRSKAAE